MFKTVIKLASTICAGIVVAMLAINLIKAKTPPPPVELSPIPPLESIFQPQEGKFPALVRLETTDGSFFCSGTAISDSLVLTAAHRLNGAMLTVRSLPNAEQKYTVVAAMPIMANQRADYGLITGNFKKFAHLNIQTDPSKDIFYFPSSYVACGNPWGSSAVCYPIVKPLKKYFDGFLTDGQLYPGMSGGPVIDLKTGLIVAVNSAVGADGIIVVPLIGLFESIGR
jgi:hypothetical protein